MQALCTMSRHVRRCMQGSGNVDAEQLECASGCILNVPVNGMRQIASSLLKHNAFWTGIMQITGARPQRSAAADSMGIIH